jgi:hypothetical protein
VGICDNRIAEKYVIYGKFQKYVYDWMLERNVTDSWVKKKAQNRILEWYKIYLTVKEYVNTYILI